MSEASIQHCDYCYLPVYDCECWGDEEAIQRVDYAAYLQSAKWQAKRMAALRYYGRRCFRCGLPAYMLNIHHETYVRLGCENLNDLKPLCRRCHLIVTESGQPTVEQATWS